MDEGGCSPLIIVDGALLHTREFDEKLLYRGIVSRHASDNISWYAKGKDGRKHIL